MKSSLRRRLAYGSNATLVTFMVLGLLVVTFVIADLYRVRWDFSEDAANTIQEDTRAKLELLDAEGIPVTITAFTAQRGKEDAYFKNRAVKDLLTELGHRSQVLEWRQVDFDKERLTAERLGVNDYGRIVVQRGEDRVDLKDRELFRRVGKGAERRLEFVGETSVSRALSQLLTPKRRVVYVLTGHGEIDPSGRGPDGMSELVGALDEERYDVEKLDLLSTGRDGESPRVPDDAALVFVARPKGVLSPSEEDILLAWIGRGGPVLFSVDVGAFVPELLGRLGVRVSEGVVSDEKVLFPYLDRPRVQYRSHPITSELQDDDLVTAMAQIAPLSAADPPPEGVRVSKVVSTSRSGWIERGGPMVNGRAAFQPAFDGAGPVDIALALELTPGKGLVRQSKGITRVAVVGDGDVFTNSLMAEYPGNIPFALNTIHWLAGQDVRLGVGSGRATRARRLAMTRQETGMLRVISLGLMPIIVLVIGIAVWLSRRGR